jgi:uncharacterized membrane protein
MEFLFVVLLGLIIYLLITHKSSLDEKIRVLDVRLIEMHKLLKQNEEILKKGAAASQPSTEPPAKPVETVKEVAKPEVPQPSPKPDIIEKRPEIVADYKVPASKPLPPKPSPYIPPVKQREPELSFFERHPDLEKFIGENLINKIGIAILVLAIGFFVKYAIDNNWIGPAGRVGIGFLFGGILVGVAHRLRNSYTAFSSVLVGGGLAIFYFTVTLAFHQFHLFGQVAAFVILIVITSFAVVLSLLYNKQELAVTALVGGLASPFMVSTGHANYHGLFIYLVVLNTGLLVVAYYKAWRILNISAFGLTVIVFAAIMYTLTAATYYIGFIYLSVLYLLFFFINIANNLREGHKFIASDFSILLLNTALYFGAGLYLLTAMHLGQWRGAFSASLAAVNLLLSYILFHNKKLDGNVLYLLIGITLTFISLTAPIQLNGHYITIFWAAECVLLYWLYLKSSIQLMKLAALVIWGAMLISLLMDWVALYGYTLNMLPVVINKGFITTLFAAICSYLLYTLIIRDESAEIYGFGNYPRFYLYAALALFFLSGLLEINHQFASRYFGTQLNSIYNALYITFFAYAIIKLANKVSVIRFKWQVNGVLIATVVLTYFLFIPPYYNAQYAMLVEHKASSMHIAAQCVSAVFAALLLYELVVLAKEKLPADMQQPASWVLAVAAVMFLSIEVSLLANHLFFSAKNTLDDIQTVYIKTGLPILWGLSSFAMMWLGMRHKYRTLRIISLSLFALTLIKLFLFDIRNIPPAGKIAAFFCLGILLLVISFMYQKVKKIIVADEDDKA